MRRMHLRVKRHHWTRVCLSLNFRLEPHTKQEITSRAVERERDQELYSFSPGIDRTHVDDGVYLDWK